MNNTKNSLIPKKIILLLLVTIFLNVNYTLGQSCVDFDNTGASQPTSSHPSLLSGSKVEFTQVAFTDIFWDSCLGGAISDTIIEYYCPTPSTYLGISLACPSGHPVCVNRVDGARCVECSSAVRGACRADEICQNNVCTCTNECQTGDAGCDSPTRRWYCSEANDGDTCLDKVIESCNTAIGETCTNGQCSASTPTCSDSDSAVGWQYTEIFLPGRVTYNGNTLPPDSCQSSAGILENYCETSSAWAQQILSCNYNNIGPNNFCTTDASSWAFCNCNSECSNRNVQCFGTNSYQICGNYDIDSCFEWGNQQFCNSGEICSGGDCIVNCFNTCTANSKQCYTNQQYQICGDFNGDGCNEWSTPIDCNMGEACSGGVCSLCLTCPYWGYECGTYVNDCGESLNCGTCTTGSCIANHCQLCIDSDEGPNDIFEPGTVSIYITDFTTPAEIKNDYCDSTDPNRIKEYSCTRIGTGKDKWILTTRTCLQGTQCVTDTNNIGYCPCIDECSPENANQCSRTTSYQTCGNYDSDSCLEWSITTDCNSGEICNPSTGTCYTTCQITNAQWTDTSFNPITSTVEGIKVILDVSFMGDDCNSKEVQFTIIEDDGGTIFNPNDVIISYPNDPLTMQSQPQEWTAQWQCDNGIDVGGACVLGNNPEYFFEVFLTDSPSNLFTSQNLEVGQQGYSNVCGDGTQDPLEECDDNNLIDGDGCSHLCEFESCEALYYYWADTNNNEIMISQPDGTQVQIYVQGSQACRANRIINKVEIFESDTDLDHDLILTETTNLEFNEATLIFTFPWTTIYDHSSYESGTDDPPKESEYFFKITFDSGTKQITSELLKVYLCGNNIPESGEECDNGASNSDTNPDACRLDCKLPKCGDSVKDTGEQCDEGDTNPGGTCNELCQQNILPTISCDECSVCSEPWCNQNICVNFCPGSGSCYYQQGATFSNDCKDCKSATSCNKYKNRADCEGDICGLLTKDRICNGVDIINDCRDPSEAGTSCRWASNKCVADIRCEWDCSGLYGPCQGDNFKEKIGQNCNLKSGDCNQESDNPGPNYPQKIACNLFEESFLVFTWFNLVISLLLITSYYVIRKR